MGSDHGQAVRCGHAPLVARGFVMVGQAGQGGDDGGGETEGES